MKALKEIITIGFGDVLGSVISVAFWFYLAIIVLPSDYGEIHYIISLATLLSTITLLGTGNTFTVYLAKNKTVSSSLLFLSIIAGLLTVMVSIILDNFIIGLLVFGIIIFVYGSTRDIAKRESKKYALNIIIQKTLSVCLAFLGLQIAGVEGVIYGIAISYFFYIRYIFQDLKNRYWRLSDLKNDFKEIKINSKFIFSNYFLIISDSVTKQSDKLLIAPIMGLTFLGNYSLALQIISVFTIFPAVIFKFFLPNLITGNISKNLQRNTILLSFVFVFIGVIVMPVIIPTYFEKYTDIVTLIQIMSFSIIPLTINQFYFGKFMSQENGKIPLIGLIISSMIMLVGMITLGTIFGDIGVAITHVGTFSFLTGYYYFSFKILKIQS